jgi:hypothetical protein
MHFTVAGLFALAMAVAATPVAVQVSNYRRSVSAPSKQLWHATPEKGVDFNHLQQKCGNLIVSCCNQANKNKNEGEISGLAGTAAVILSGVLPGNENSACTAATPAILDPITELFTGPRMCTICPERHVSSTYILIEQRPRLRTSVVAPPMHAAPEKVEK